MSELIQQPSEAIFGFHGEYRFLSSFYILRVGLGTDHGIAPSVEHAYQASKFTDKKLINLILGVPKPGMAKKIANEHIDSVIPNWDNVKVPVMEKYTLEKFFNNEELLHKLRETKPLELVEKNTWNDTFWGVSPEGQNFLGRILMCVRECESPENYKSVLD